MNHMSPNNLDIPADCISSYLIQLAFLTLEISSNRSWLDLALNRLEVVTNVL